MRFGSHSDSLFAKPQPVPCCMAPAITGDLGLKQAISVVTAGRFCAFIIHLRTTYQDDQPPHTFRSTQLETVLRRADLSNICRFLPSKQKEGELYPCGPVVSLHDQGPLPMWQTPAALKLEGGGWVLTQPCHPPFLGNVSFEF